MPEKIRVAIDIRDLRIAKTGVRTYLEELVKVFKDMDGDAFTFYYLDTLFPVYTGKNKFLKLIEHGRFIAWKQLILPFMAWINGCDIIFCADFFVPYFSPGAKTIPVLHDAFFFEYPRHYNKAWLFLFKTLGIAAAKKATRIITPTLYTKQQISKLSGLPAEKIVVVYEGPKSFAPGKNEEDLLLKSLEGNPYLLHVGVLEKRKNILNLLRAYLLLQRELPEIRLVLVGQFSPKTDMDDQQAIKSFIREHALEEKVMLTGYVPDARLSAWYKNALMYVFPSINEGFGIPVLEAFEHRLPVLIANNSCLPEVAGDAALSFDPFDPDDIYLKIRTLAENAGLRQELVKKGAERVQLFTWQRTAAQLLEVFRDTLIKKKS